MTSFLGYRDGSGFTNEQGLKQELNKLLTKGVSSVHSSTSLQVTQRGAGANMSVDVAVGDAHLVLPSGLYSYWGWTDAVTNVTITAANPSNPRIDVIVADVDLAITTGTNNAGALKFTAIPGTAAASPSVPSDSTIQAAVGANVPFVKLAQVAVATSASNIVNANITDIRQPIAVKTRLWGGSSNTNGHTVPNAADANVALTSDSGGKINFAALLSTIFSGQLTAYTNPGSAGGSFKYINLGGIKIFHGMTASIPVSGSGFQSTTRTITFPTSFFSSIDEALLTVDTPTNTPYLSPGVSSKSAVSMDINLNQSNGANGAAAVNVWVTGT